jgi:hypothetical protein
VAALRVYATPISKACRYTAGPDAAGAASAVTCNQNSMTTTSVPATTTVPYRRRVLSVGGAWAAAGCLVIPAAANTAYHLLTPVTSGTTAGAVAQAAAHPALAQVVVLQFALPVLALGVAALAWRASAVTARLAVTAGAVLAGAFLLSPLASLPELLTAILPRFTGTAAAARAVNGYGHTFAGHVGAIALIGQALGLILMAIALWRSRITPRWLAAAFGVTLPLQVLTHGGTDERVFALSWVWFTVVLVLCGTYLIRAARAERHAGAESAGTTGLSGLQPHETMAG